MAKITIAEGDARWTRLRKGFKGADFAEIRPTFPGDIRCTVADIHTLDQLHCLLEGMRTRPALCLLRGQPLTPGEWTPRDSEHVRGGSADWISFDVDGWGGDDDADPSRVWEHLPRILRTGCVWQRTGSAGVPGKGLRLRFYYLQTAPVPAPLWAAIARLGREQGVNLDPCVIQPRQPVFVADPVFVDCLDPVPKDARIGIIKTEEFLLDADEIFAYCAQLPTHLVRVSAETPERPAGVVYCYLMGAWPHMKKQLAEAPVGERQHTLVQLSARVVGLSIAARVDPAPMLAEMTAAELERRPEDAHDINRVASWARKTVVEPKYPPMRTSTDETPSTDS